MAATSLHWIIVFLALMNAGYMLFDGARAILTGDYLRPKSGEYAGQLGPWTKIAEKIGIDPMATLMKLVFVGYGVAGLALTACFALGIPWAWKALLIFNVCALWNLFFGTASSAVQIALLVILRMIRPA